MEIIGIGYIPSSIKWVVDYMIEVFGEEILKDSIEIYGTKENGYETQFELSIGMIFEIDLKGKYFFISTTLLDCRTPEKKYLLKKEGLGLGLREAIDRMKVLILDELDSILKVKK